MAERAMRFEDRMSDHEAVMWNVEKDPWLNPSGAALVILDRPVDMPQLRRRMRYAVSRIPRLYERVVPALGRLSTPAWAPDPEFDFDYHLRHIALPAPGDERQLLDLVTRLYEDPFDRTRPLWMFVAIDGLEGGRGALFSKVHHAVSDGVGALRMAESFQELKRREKPPPEIDLDAVVAAAVVDRFGELKESGGDIGGGLVEAATKSVGHLVRRQTGIARRTVGEVAQWPAHPGRVREVAEDVVGNVGSALGQLTGSGNEVRGGSPIWRTRSRRRHLEAIRLSLDEVKQAARTLGGSVNDAFVAGAVEGAVRYHVRREVVLDALNISFVVSTRTDDAMGGNSFTPTLVQVPAGPMTIEKRFLEVRDRMAARRTEVGGGGGASALMGVANLLPTSVLTRTARAAASRLDFATSNLRGAPFPVFVSGAKVLRNIPMGPVAGTACNITTLSYNGALDIGLLIDPAAVEDPAELRQCLEDAYADLVDAARPDVGPSVEDLAADPPAEGGT